MNGVLNINKPSGVTSHDVVNQIRKIYQTKKVGHTGTLDPLATGVLPICIGKATRISEYLMAEDKTYVATLAFGSSTDTLDSEGEIIETHSLPSLEKNEVEDVLNSFIGKQKQIPPLYSAIKVGGKPLYKYARNNQEVEVPEREVTIHSISLINYSPEAMTLEINCSKGTYIRTLMADIAAAMKSGGHVTALMRTKSGHFTLKEAVDLSSIDDSNKEVYLTSLEQALEALPSCTVTDDENKKRLYHGNAFLDENCKQDHDPVVIYVNGKVVAIGKAQESWIYPKKLLMPEVIFNETM